MTQQFQQFIAELDPLPAWVRNDMNKIQKCERARVDAQNQVHRAARNFFLFAEKNKRHPQAINSAAKKSTEKIKEL